MQMHFLALALEKVDADFPIVNYKMTPFCSILATNNQQQTVYM